MKYLKRFSALLEQSNQSLTDDEVEELKDFCESSLAYLLDDGYEVYIQRECNVGFHVVFGLPGPEDSEYFYWNDVKDYYIPFLKLLSRRYKLGTYPWRYHNNKSGNVFFNSDNSEYYTVDQVINDENDIIEYIWGINIKVVDKL